MVHLHLWSCTYGLVRERVFGRVADWLLGSAQLSGAASSCGSLKSAVPTLSSSAAAPCRPHRGALQCRRWCGSRVEMCGVSPAARRFNSFMVAPSSLTRHPSWWCSGVSSPACQERARSWSLACQERALACACMSVNTCSHVQRTCSSRGRPLKLRADGVRHRALRNLGRIAVGHVTILD